MERMDVRIKQAQADINRRRSLEGKPPAEDVNRLPKYKKNKLLKGRR